MAEFDLPSGVEGNALAMALWAQALLQKGRADESFRVALAAAELAPGDIEVRDRLSAALTGGIPDYHLPMLHDERRNRAYAAALERSIRPGMVVLEIGSGAGLLSLLAARAGAQVYTCEQVPAIAAAARVIAERNGLADRIHVMAKNSTELRVGEDLPRPADLLMSELFDDTLFGDNIVGFVADAKERLLSPGASIIPPRSELRCALVERSRPVNRRPIGTVEGFDLSPFNILAPRSCNWQMVDERTAQRSDAASALAKDFSGLAPFGPDEAVLQFRSEGGRVDGVAQWLRIDFGGGAIYENDPFAGEWSHWGAPIYLFAKPIETAPGDLVQVEIRRADTRLFVRPVIASGEPERD